MLACAIVIGIPAIGGIAATVTGTFNTQTFADWLNGLGSSASLSASDAVPIRQNGVMKKWLPFNYFLDHTASNVADAAAARTNLGVMARDASNVDTAATARTNLLAMDRSASEAILPTARNNLLYTPATCDGYRSTTAAMTSGSNVLTDNSATFTQADVGKAVSVNGAGPTQYIRSATVAGGGTGHSVNEVIALTGGTGTAGSVVVRSLSGSAIATAAGQPGSLGSYTVVPGNPVTVGDATLNITWSRDNLVGTIGSVLNSHQITLVDGINNALNASATVSNAMWAYGTDVAPTINAAAANGVRIAYAPTTKCVIASPLTVSSLALLEGTGRGGYTSGATGLVWAGPVGGNVISADTGAAINGAKIGPFFVDGLCSASAGAYLRGLQWSDVDVAVLNTKDYGLYLEGASSGTDDAFFNRIRVAAHQSNVCSTAADAIMLNGTGSGHDANGNAFYELEAEHKDGVGLNLVNSYVNRFVGGAQIFGGAGNGWSVVFGGSNTANKFARENSFDGLIAQNAILAVGGGVSNPSRDNVIYQLASQGSPVVVTIQSGATLFCWDHGRNADYCTAYATNAFTCGSPTGTTTTANFVAMGCGGSGRGTVTPRWSGKLHLSITGSLMNGTATNGDIAQIWHGTGTAPVNGDNIESVGTACGGTAVLGNTPSTTFQAPASLPCDVILTPGTTYWYDLGLKSAGGGTASALNLRLLAKETP